MFSLEPHGGGPGQARLVARDQLTPADFAAIATGLNTLPVRARKAGFITAREATRPERIVTRWNGEETANTAEPGDFIATNLSPERAILRDAGGNANIYVIRAARFPELYEPVASLIEHGRVYRARGIVEALPLPGGFEILAPWGEQQRAESGYLLMNGSEIYGNATATFEATYRRI